MQSGTFVDALDESFEYLVSSPTPQYIVDYRADEAKRDRLISITAPQLAPPPNAQRLNRWAAQAKRWFKWRNQPQ
jgi:hypothetical protein